MKYVLKESKEKPGWWTLTDTEAMMVVTFKERHFNDTQRVTLLDGAACTDPLGVARALRGMAEYMAENHPHTAY